MKQDKEFEKDLEILRTHSKFAYCYGKKLDPETMLMNINCSVGSILYSNPQEVLTIFDWDKSGAHPDDSFHPVDSGCIRLQDDYLFGIRCEHMIWIDYHDYSVNAAKTLLIGNHKGETHFRVITYNEKVYEEE